MDESVARYMEFIDSLVDQSHSVEAKRVEHGQLYELPSKKELERLMRQGNAVGLATHEEQAMYNQMLSSLSESQRLFVAKLIQDERASAIHDVLAVLNDGHYQLSQNGVRLAFEPFGTESYFDFSSRLIGNPWPDESV